ncbi:hypothetical protein SEA_SWEATNTEARS_32 [Gordonia phage SweatNTears]|nr:hypothetical protein SEA_SWEATNTEARS_32 [Gordonia phage SweatNTears]
MSNATCVESFTLANGETVACNRKAAPKNQVMGHDAVCLKCYEAWMMMNEHNDYGHDEPVADCPECGTYDLRVKQGHTKNKGKKQVHTSHAECDHAKTPVARAKCRKARAKELAPAPEVNADAPEDDHFGDTPFDEADYDTEPVKVSPLQKAYDALTDKQRDQALIVIDGQGVATDIDTELVQSLTLALVERARAKKTTVAKLSKGDVRNVIAIDSL